MIYLEKSSHYRHECIEGITSPKELGKRIAIYLFGFLVLTLGQRLFVEAGFGAGALDALCVGLGLRLGLTGGTWVSITAVGMILISACLCKRKPHYGALISSYVFGLLFDFWGWVLEAYVLGWTLPVRIAMYLLGIILAPLGTAIYFRSHFSKSALDDFIMAVKERYKLSVRAAKTIVEVTLCILGFLIGGPIGITTVTTAILFGPILQIFIGLLDSRYAK